MSVKHVQEIIKEMEKNCLRPELIQDNKIVFTDENEIYRVRMPNQLELLEADREKNAYQVKLIQQENTMTLFQLKKVLKEKQGVDIDDMEKQLVALEDDLAKVWEKMVKKHDDDTEGIEEVKKELRAVEDKRAVLNREISERIAPSIDEQSDNYYMSYLTSVCTEKNEELDDTMNEEEKTKPKWNIFKLMTVNGKKEKVLTGVAWNSVWNSFDEYLNQEESSLKYFAMGYLTTLIMKVRS